MQKVSILIVGRNEETNLPKLFDSLKKLTYPKDSYEVVYVDDASSDRSPEIAKAYGAIVHRAERRQGRGGIRNLALSKAKHPLVAWIDADCEVVDPDWLQQMLGHLGGAVAGVSGHQMRPPIGLPRLISYLPGMMVEVNRAREASWAPTTSSLFIKRVLIEAGGYRNDLVTAEDLEICWRLGEKGWKFVHIPEAKVVHHFRATLDGFVRQQWERGVFGAALIRRYRKGAFATAFNALWFGALLAAAIGVFFPPLLAAIAVVPFLLYMGLDGIHPVTGMLAGYRRDGGGVGGMFRLLALNYIKTAALLGGILRYQFGSLVGHAYSL